MAHDPNGKPDRKLSLQRCPTPGNRELSDRRLDAEDPKRTVLDHIHPGVQLAHTTEM